MTGTELELRKKTENREGWLIGAVEAMTHWYEAAGHQVPPVRVSVGWPGGRGPKKTVRGQCWAPLAAEDGIPQIFISPTQADTVTTLAVLLHEMAHAIDSCESGHRGNFITVARAVGFKSKWTSSDYRTEELQAQLEELAEQLGDFPSAAIGGGGGSEGAGSGAKKQTTRQLKAECPEGSGYKVRLTQTWSGTYGTPFCPHCNSQMEVPE